MLLRRWDLFDLIPTHPQQDELTLYVQCGEKTVPQRQQLDPSCTVVVSEKKIEILNP